MDEDWQNDEIAEQLRYQEFGVLNAQLIPCPSCGGKVTISFCEWDCCRAKARNIECDCGIYTGPEIDKWNDRTTVLRNWYDDLKEFYNEGDTGFNGVPFTTDT